MPTPIDPARLPGLKQAFAAHKDDDWLSQQQLADIYGVSPARLSTLIKSRFETFPPFERRDDKTHWYPARAAIRAMIAYLESTSDQKLAQAARHSAIMSGVVATKEVATAEAAAPAPVAPPPMSATELDKLASAQTKIWRLAQEQGRYIERAKVEAITRAVLQIITREITNLPTTMDPNGELPITQKAALAKRARSIVIKANTAMAELLGEEDAGSDGGSTGTGTGTRRNLRRGDVRKSA